MAPYNLTIKVQPKELIRNVNAWNAARKLGLVGELGVVVGKDKSVDRQHLTSMAETWVPNRDGDMFIKLMNNLEMQVGHTCATHNELARKAAMAALAIETDDGFREDDRPVLARMLKALTEEKTPMSH